MGLSARKRVRLGPIILNTSASSRGPSSSLSLGTQNRKKGQLNVTYNSKRGLTLSLYGTGVKWKSTTKGGGKTGLTKSQISANSKRKASLRKAEKDRRDSARKAEMEANKIIKLTAKAEAKKDSVVASIIRKINTARGNIIEGLDIDIDELKMKNVDPIRKVELIEKYWAGKNLKIRKLCEKKISGALSSEVFSEFDFNSVNACLIEELDASEELDEDSCLVTPLGSSLEWVVDKDSLRKLLNSSLYEVGFEALQIETTRLINQFVVDCVSRNDEKIVDLILSKFGLSSDFFDYSLFDYDDPSFDYLIELSDVGLADEVADSAIKSVIEYTTLILEDGIIDDDELETISLIFARFARLLRRLESQISKDYYGELSENLGQIRVDMFLTGTSLLFSNFSDLEIPTSMKTSDALLEVIEKYELYRSIFGKKSDLEDFLPLKGAHLIMLEETNLEIERSIVVYIEEVNNFYNELLSSVSEFKLIKENLDDIDIASTFDSGLLFDILDDTLSNSLAYSTAKESCFENQSNLIDKMDALVNEYFSSSNKKVLKLESQLHAAAGSRKKEQKIRKKADILMKEYSSHSYLLSKIYVPEYSTLRSLTFGIASDLQSTNKKNGVVDKFFGAVYKLGKFFLYLLFGLAMLGAALEFLGITD
jgi:hypothetical protein